MRETQPQQLAGRVRECVEADGECCPLGVCVIAVRMGNNRGDVAVWDVSCAKGRGSGGCFFFLQVVHLQGRETRGGMEAKGREGGNMCE